MFKKVALYFAILTLTLIPVWQVSAEEQNKFEDETIYSIMVDRFLDGDDSNNEDVDMLDPLKYNGGDFKGIISKLDYLKDMGFTAIQLSPIFANETDGYHGEWTVDYESLEEHFGSIDDLNELIEEVHKREMKIIVEFPIDTIGEAHPWINDETKSEWFSFTGEKPTLTLSNVDVQEYLIESAISWLDQTDLDGYHLANVDKADDTFLENFANEIKTAHKDIFLQATSNANGNIDYLLDAGFDRISNTAVTDALIESFIEPDTSTSELLDYQLSANPEKLTLYFDDKDLVRYTKYMADALQYPGARWTLALGYLYTQPSLPSVYYATELAINAGEAPENRPLMNFRTDDELIKTIEKLGKIRNEQPALRRGTMEVLYEDQGMTVYKREYKDDVIVVAINNTEKDQVFSISADQLVDNKELHGLFGTDLIRSKDGEYKFIIERDVLEIYKLSDKTGINYMFLVVVILVPILFFVFIFAARKRSKQQNS